ncbi:MAG: PD-(D/E)XK nuclease family protein, partial [bacterium]|nr:PD-(D/E)XK nuclease family protein [bacterium]
MFSISPFKISLFDQCPLKYKFKYIDKLDKDLEIVPSTHLLIGKIVHDTLNDFFSIPGERSSVRLNEILHSKIFRVCFQHKDYEEILNECLELINNFSNEEELSATPEFREENISVDFNDYTLICKVDRLEKKDIWWEIIDYKTGKIQITEEELSRNIPNRIYPLAVKYGLGLEVKRLTLFYLRTMKKISIDIADDDFAKIKDALNKKVNEIRTLRPDEFSPKRNPFCNTCEFKLLCPETGNKSVSQFSLSSGKEYLRNLE